MVEDGAFFHPEADAVAQDVDVGLQRQLLSERTISRANETDLRRHVFLTCEGSHTEITYGVSNNHPWIAINSFDQKPNIVSTMHMDTNEGFASLFYHGQTIEPETATNPFEAAFGMKGVYQKVLFEGPHETVSMLTAPKTPYTELQQIHTLRIITSSGIIDEAATERARRFITSNQSPQQQRIPILTSPDEIAKVTPQIQQDVTRVLATLRPNIREVYSRLA